MSASHSILYLRNILSKREYTLLFSLLFLIFFIILSITSNFIVPLPLQINPFTDPLLLLIIFCISLLISLNATLLFYNHSNKEKHTLPLKLSVIGSTLAFFTTSCPFCYPPLLMWAGLGSAAAFISGFNLSLGLISIVFLALSIHFLLKRQCSNCEVMKK
ncbi:MAG: hypothetical protein QXW70_01745 [Candidatus Anstonellales archaeon]